MLAFLLACSLCFIVLAGSVSLLRYWCTRYLRKQRDTPDRTAPRLSKDTGLIRPEYDVVVIGSGYGGGVAASRMARAGKSVCLLERGAESWSGEYPHTLQGALQEYRINDKRRGRSSGLGKVDGLYQTVKGAGQDVFLGCGLGGTSLINAGVYLRADERVFKGKEWPAEIREHTDDLSQCKHALDALTTMLSDCSLRKRRANVSAEIIPKDLSNTAQIVSPRGSSPSPRSLESSLQTAADDKL